MAGYVTLPSNVDFPGNTNSTFTVKLEHPLVLESGQWEAGLVDIHYPTTWANVPDGAVECVRSVVHEDGTSSDESVSLSIREGRYSDFNELVREISRNLRGKGLDTIIAVYYNSIRNLSFIRIRSEGYKLKFAPSLASAFGFVPGRYYEQGKHESSTRPDLNAGFTSLYVYSKIVEARPVGDVMAPLLRVVPVKADERFANTYIEFTNVHYLPVPNTSTNLIEVLIRRDNGEEIPFSSGKVILTVHFRRVRDK
jgi:hypothetical protein